MSKSIWLAVDKDGSEYGFDVTPERFYDRWTIDMYLANCLNFPKGTIKKFIEKELTWEDEPVEYKGEKVDKIISVSYMTTIKTEKGEFLFVEVPEDAYEFKIEIDFLIYRDDKTSIWNEGTPINIPENFIGEIISTTKDITEEQAASVVENINDKMFIRYSDYTRRCKTAKESLQSLIQANELNVNKNYLILKYEI